MINMTRDDINRTYAESFLGLHTEQGIVPVHVNEGLDNNTFAGRVYLTKSKSEVRSIDINDPQLVLSYPDSGAYNVAGKQPIAGYVGRKAERQWRRGISPRHLHIEGDLSFSHDLVRAMLNPSYADPETALSVLSGVERGAVAISRDWWYQKSPRYKNTVVWFRGSIVGEFKNDAPVIPNKFMNGIYEEAFHV